MQKFTLKDWQVKLSYLPKQRRDVTLEASSIWGKSYVFQSLVLRDQKLVVVVMVPLKGLMKVQVANINNVEITVIYMNAQSLVTYLLLVYDIGNDRYQIVYASPELTVSMNRALWNIMGKP